MAALALVVGVIGWAAPAAGARQGGGDRLPWEDGLDATIADLDDFWSAEYPKLYGTPYETIPRDHIFKLAPNSAPVRCTYGDGPAEFIEITYENTLSWAAGAWYPGCDILIYNTAGVSSFYEAGGGDYGVASLFAHEWAHGMQDRFAPVDSGTILEEQQADCFAGAFTRYLAGGEARLHLKGGELDRMLAIQLGVRDPVGGVPTEEGFVARGNGFDLVRAFKDGFDEGGSTCATYFEDPPQSTTIEFRDAEEEQTRGNLPDTHVVAVTVDLLNAYYGKVEPAYQPLTIDDVVLFDPSKSANDPPECGGRPPPAESVKNRLYFCLADGRIVADRDYLQTVYDRTGDFGVASLLAHVFATYVQTLQGIPGVRDNSKDVLLGADCYTGAFAGAMVDGLTSDALEPVGEPQVVSLSPGDLDEMLFAAIDHDKISGAKQTADFTFRRVATLEDGFFGGYESCAVFAGR